LKFFYQLDVDKSNASVLFNEATGKLFNIATFKKELVNKLIGHKIRNNPIQLSLEHSLKCGEGHLKHVYCCDMFSNANNRRTRYYSVNAACMLPLCNIDHDKNIHDCFALAHMRMKN